VKPHRILPNQTIFRKIEQDNCFIIQQIANKIDFAARKTVVVQGSGYGMNLLNNKSLY